MSDQTILVTGAAGFIGFHAARRLLAEGRTVVGLDNLNSYYDPALKQARLDVLRADSRFSFVQADLADRASMRELFGKNRFARVLHLAAQAGVRYSIDHPHAYADANLEGFVNVLEGCRHHGCGIWSMRRRRRSTAPIPSCRFRSTTGPIIRSAFMPRPKRPTK